MKLCGTPKVRPVVSHSSVGKLWPNAKPAVPSFGVIARDAAVEQQAAERDDEGLHAHLRDQEAVDRAEHEADADRDEDRHRPRHFEGHEQIDEDHAEQREHRADRQIDAAGDDDEALADGEQAEEADQVGRVRQVDRRDEARVDQRDDGADDEDEEEEPEVLLQHAGSRASMLSPTASRITFAFAEFVARQARR